MEAKALSPAAPRFVHRPIELVLVRANSTLFYGVAAASLLERRLVLLAARAVALVLDRELGPNRDVDALAGDLDAERGPGLEGIGESSPAVSTRCSISSIAYTIALACSIPQITRRHRSIDDAAASSSVG